MSRSPNEHNLKYGWLNKAKFEREKALKEESTNCSPWPREAWQAAAERYRSGIVEPERRFPIIITSSGGPFTTTQKLQEAIGLPSTPEGHWTTKTSFRDPDEEEEAMKNTEGQERPETVQYCHVNYEELLQVQDISEGEEFLIWFRGKKRVAWQAHSLKKSDNPASDGGN